MTRTKCKVHGCRADYEYTCKFSFYGVTTSSQLPPARDEWIEGALGEKAHALWHEVCIVLCPMHYADSTTALWLKSPALRNLKAVDFGSELKLKYDEGRAVSAEHAYSMQHHAYGTYNGSAAEISSSATARAQALIKGKLNVRDLLDNVSYVSRKAASDSRLWVVGIRGDRPPGCVSETYEVVRRVVAHMGRSPGTEEVALDDGVVKLEPCEDTVIKTESQDDDETTSPDGLVREYHDPHRPETTDWNARPQPESKYDFITHEEVSRYKEKCIRRTHLRWQKKYYTHEDPNHIYRYIPYHDPSKTIEVSIEKVHLPPPEQSRSDVFDNNAGCESENKKYVLNLGDEDEIAANSILPTAEEDPNQAVAPQRRVVILKRPIQKKNADKVEWDFVQDFKSHDVKIETDIYVPDVVASEQYVTCVPYLEKNIPGSIQIGDTISVVENEGELKEEIVMEECEPDEVSGGSGYQLSPSRDGTNAVNLLECRNEDCEKFPLDVANGQMYKHHPPLLVRTEILQLEDPGKKIKRKSELDSECLLQDVKYESPTEDVTGGGIEVVSESDVKVELPKDGDGDIYADDEELDDDQPLGRLRQELSTAAVQSLAVEGVDASSGRKLKRKSSRKEIKWKERGKRPRTHKRPGRKESWLDPAKVQLIKLTPAEQARQREEDSRNETYLRFLFKCERCYKGFHYEEKLKNHMAKHDASRGVYECNVCGMRLPTVYSYNVHTATHSTRYECVACERRMANKGSILEHYARTHEGAAARFCCHVCGKVFTNSRTYHSHMRNSHSGDRPKCDHCGKTFVNKDSLNEHILIHKGVKEHACETCGQRFRTHTQVRYHQLKHSDVRDFYCVECDMQFKSRHNLRQHLLKSTRHADAESLQHACDRCDKHFASPKSLEHHVQFQHLGRRLHVCATCGLALGTHHSLTKHVRATHEGYRAPLKHVCETCGKAFRDKSVLINHLRVHTGEKPYDCNECGRKFSQRAAMQTHIKLVHLKIKRNASVTSIVKTNSGNIAKKTTENLTTQQRCVVGSLPGGHGGRSIVALDVVRPVAGDRKVPEIAVKINEDRETKTAIRRPYHHLTSNYQEI